MQEYEAAECIKNVEFTDKNDRMVQRYQLYVAIQSNSKKQLKPQDILELPWDDRFLNKTEFEYNEKEEAMLKRQADIYAKMMEKGNLNFTENADLMKSEDKNISENK